MIYQLFKSYTWAQQLFDPTRYLKPPLLPQRERESGFSSRDPKIGFSNNCNRYTNPLHANHHLKKGNKPFPDRYVSLCVVSWNISNPFPSPFFYTCQVIRVVACFTFMCCGKKSACVEWHSLTVSMVSLTSDRTPYHPNRIDTIRIETVTSTT